MQLKGFTLIEVLVSLSLIGIICTLGGLVFTCFTQMYGSYQNQVDQAYAYLRFFDAMSYDMEKSSVTVLRSQQVLRLEDDDGEIVSAYSIQSERVIRKRTIIPDTFPLVLESFVQEGEQVLIVGDSAGNKMVFVREKEGKLRRN